MGARSDDARIGRESRFEVSRASRGRRRRRRRRRDARRSVRLCWF